MKYWWLVALCVLFGLLSAGVVLLASQPPRGKPIALLPPPTPIQIKVHVSGEVLFPGVYALPPGDRVQDAIEAAGGFTDKANTSGLNLASPLEDGQFVQVIPKIKIEDPAPTVPDKFVDLGAQLDPTSSSKETISPYININTADQKTLELLSGIGPAIAQNIIAFREENGPFKSIEEVQKVSGIGPVKFENIRDYITVDQQP